MRRSGRASQNRSGGGFDPSNSEMQDLNREAQNRWCGGEESQRFQDFQRPGGGERFG
jgi:hypothetical protein